MNISINKCKCNFFNSNGDNDRSCQLCQKNDLELEKQEIQKNINRCWQCRKKIGLTGIKCRCNYYFCSSHRYPEEHKCKIDYKKINKDILRKNIIKCQFSKINKI